MEEKMNQILANQAVIYKRLCKIEDALIKNRTRSAPDSSYFKELKSESEEFLKLIKSRV